MSVTMQATDAAAILSEVRLFRSLTPDEIDDIAGICVFEEFPAGTWLFHAGDKGSSMWILIEGAVDVVIEGTREHETLARLRKHNILGELSLIEPDVRTAAAFAAEPTRALRIDYDRFSELRERLNTAAHKVLRELSRVVCLRIRDVNERIEATAARQQAASARAETERLSDDSANKRRTLTELLQRLWSPRG